MMENGRLYDKKDMVKAGCHDCIGCAECCTGMGDTVILDPGDVYRLTSGLGKSMEEMMDKWVSLHVEDGIILPHVRMTGENGHCVFLNEEGRCRIHAYRPGLCRLFPLGRQYEEGSVKYFLLEACPAKNKTKVKIEKWLDIPDVKQYESFLATWHYLLKSLREKKDNAQEINVLLLKVFFFMPYKAEKDFYSQFAERLVFFQESGV